MPTYLQDLSKEERLEEKKYNKLFSHNTNQYEIALRRIDELLIEYNVDKDIFYDRMAWYVLKLHKESTRTIISKTDILIFESDVIEVLKSISQNKAI